jgi:hypothetical protein
LGEFSADNWADSNERNPANFPSEYHQGRTPTKDIERVVSKLRDEHWDTILEFALAFCTNQRAKRGSRQSEGTEDHAQEGAVQEAGEESDFELEDDAIDTGVNITAAD